MTAPIPPTPARAPQDREPQEREGAAPATAWSLAEIARAVAERRLPPVEAWAPEHCGDSEMRIDREGQWYHQGSPIGRAALWQLFATLLRREADGSYVLVTPAEKLAILVEDAPFLAVAVTSAGEGKERQLAFRLNSEEWVIAGPDHPLSFRCGSDGAPGHGPRPYLRVRGGLEARLTRPVYYELAMLALEEGADPAGLWSNGRFFAFATSDTGA